MRKFASRCCFVRAAVIALVARSLCACTGPDPRDAAADAAVGRCRADAIASCECSDGALGTQSCSLSGAFGACRCAPSTARDGGDAADTLDAPDEGTLLDAPDVFDATVGDDTGDESDAGSAADVVDSVRICAVPVCLPGVCGQVSNPCGVQVDCGECSGFVTERDLDVQHLAWDAVHRALYATVGPSGTNANSVVAIDPATAAVVWSVPLGATPTTLDLSDDSTTAWIGAVDGTVRRVDIATRTAGPSFAVTTASIGDLQVLPGSTTSIAAVVGSGVGRGLGVFDNGAPRGGTTWSVDSIAAGPGMRLWGLEHSSPLDSGGRLTSVLMTSTGPFSNGGFLGLLNTRGTSITYVNGFLYSSDGTVLDAHDALHPFNLGRVRYRGPIAGDPVTHRAYIVTTESAVPTFFEFETDTFTVVWSVPLATTGFDWLDLRILGDGNFAVVVSRSRFGLSNQLQMFHLTLPE